MKIVGRGLYDVGEASQLTGLKEARIREWFRGRTGTEARNPVFRGDYAQVAPNLVLSFLDLIDVFVAGELREHKVSLEAIRRAHRNLSRDWGTDHPFSKREISTDGKTIFASAAAGPLYDALTANLVFDSIILPILHKIDYSKLTGLAERWRLAPHIVIDPQYCLGKPIVEGINITTRVLAESFFANKQDVRAVADWYEVEPEVIRAAVDYELGRAA